MVGLFEFAKKRTKSVSHWLLLKTRLRSFLSIL
uniref:Uncharacterized protein n=1 Tax=Rhizophora mucronata TaxID=61149 RepID=A0A2P2N6V6_RHIMU